MPQRLLHSPKVENGCFYTEDAGLPYFNRAAVKATGNWYYTSARESMGVKFCFHYRSVNIGPSYK